MPQTRYTKSGDLSIAYQVAGGGPIEIRDALPALDIEIRAGVHTGECEVIADKTGGIAVIIGSRVREQAAPGEVLATSTVKELVAGSGLRFEPRGARRLKGVPDEWQIFSAGA